MEMTMDDVKRNELEVRVKETLREHQREGLNMIGNVDQLAQRLVRAVEQWVDGDPLTRRKSA
jgi:hypothetical protein